MLNSFEIEALLEAYGFAKVETKTHAIGFARQDDDDRRVYVKDRRNHLHDARMAATKQPLVIHPDSLRLSGIDRTRAFTESATCIYKNSNMSTYPVDGAGCHFGVAVDVPDRAALDELISVLWGHPAAN